MFIKLIKKKFFFLLWNQEKLKIFKMSVVCEEILKGLSEIPAVSTPGVMVIVGEHSEAICTGDKPENVFLAASLYGNGCIFACAHDCYYKWFVEKVGGLEGTFINNVKNWLSNGNPSDDSSIIEATNIKDNMNLSKFKIIAWHGGKEISDKVYQNIGKFVQNGGGLFCAITPWGYLQITKKADLTDNQMFNFLNDNAGIILTGKHFGCQVRCAVNTSKSQNSNFQAAIDAVCRNTNEISRYSDTIDSCINNMANCDIHDTNSVLRIKDALLKHCATKGWNPVPTQNSPIKAQELKQITKLLCTCYVELGEKAPNIQEFPFDFDYQPRLISNASVKLNSEFSERLSTGYYLPAGVEISIKVLKGQPTDWKCRIGAHSDVLKPEGEYKRWPICTVVYKLKKELKFKSPFGGLVYFEWYDFSRQFFTCKIKLLI